jgi:excinuclease ABC subunit B
MDIKEGARDRSGEDGAPAKGRGAKGKEKSAADLQPQNLVRQMKRLEGEMYKKARNLEFEEAARLRDEIERLKQLELGLPSTLAS